jgi:DNA-binding transcriptional MerR regulator
VADSLLPIGMFSRASSLSIKALRAYHEAGILVPARIDPQSGYRTYTVDQLADASIVVRLRALDVSLADVRTILKARDPELTRRVLATHHTRMRERLLDTERIVAELQSGLAPVTHTPVHVRAEPAIDTVRILGDVTPATFEAWLVNAFARLARVLDERGVRASGTPGTLWAPEILADDSEHVEAFIPIAEPIEIGGSDPHVTIGEVPASRVAVLVHTGAYETMSDTYRTLGAWVARHERYSGERIREWCVVPPGTADKNAYRTEIAWPIR